MVPSFVRLKEREIDMSISVRLNMVITNGNSIATVEEYGPIGEVVDAIDIVLNQFQFDTVTFTVTPDGNVKDGIYSVRITNDDIKG